MVSVFNELDARTRLAHHVPLESRMIPDDYSIIPPTLREAIRVGMSGLQVLEG